MTVSEPIWIYGFYRKDGTAVYVGQTVWPKERERSHRTWTRNRIRDLILGCEFRLIRKTSDLDASRIESQVVSAYKRRGECIGNMRKRYLVTRYSGFTVASSDGFLFPSFSAAERHYGVKRGTVSVAFKTWGGLLRYDFTDDLWNAKKVQLRLIET